MTRMKSSLRLAVAAALFYAVSFTAIHCIPGLRRPSLDGDWYYCDVERVDSAELYGFWPLRQLGYSITGATSRHISERLPLGLPDGLPTAE